MQGGSEKHYLNEVAQTQEDKYRMFSAAHISLRMAHPFPPAYPVRRLMEVYPGLLPLPSVFLFFFLMHFLLDSYWKYRKPLVCKVLSECVLPTWAHVKDPSLRPRGKWEDFPQGQV